MTTIPPLHVRVISPREIMLDMLADSVSSTNIQGKFDILPLHVNFITLIENKPIVIRKVGQKKPIILALPMAIIVTLENTVNIYTYVIQPQSRI